MTAATTNTSPPPDLAELVAWSQNLVVDPAGTVPPDRPEVCPLSELVPWALSLAATVSRETAPLPKPTPGALVHRIAFDLSAAEFSCLGALAARWGCALHIAAQNVLCMDLVRRWNEEQDRIGGRL